MTVASGEIEQSNLWLAETLDATGKAVLDSIYNQPDPRAYWRTLSALDYRVPQQAKPYFLRCIAARREQRAASRSGTIVDLGCSYGINSLLLRFGLTISDLYRRYATGEVASLHRSALIARDRQLEPRRDLAGVRFTGIDVSSQAASYAAEASLLDDVVVADMEQRDLRPDEAQHIADATLIISTGCIGYVTKTSLTRILHHCRERAWMMHTVLRMFDFRPVEEALAQFGYVVARSHQLLKQRRFISHREQERILDGLSSVGINASGLEAEGWLYAHVYLALPVSDAGAVWMERILDPR
jgi:predicted TPR repeat methyltransferase